MAVNFEKMEVQIGKTAAASIVEFARTNGRFCNFIKEVQFLRYVGFDDQKTYLEEIGELDEILLTRKEVSGGGYVRTAQLTHQISPEKVSKYLEIFEAWKGCEGEDDRLLQCGFPFSFENRMWELAQKKAYEKVLQKYEASKQNVSPSMVRNLGVKLLGWMDAYFPQLFLDTRVLRKFPKFVYCGAGRLQEYLFLYLLAMTGCDVLYLNPAQDIAVNDLYLLGLSQLRQGKRLDAIPLPPSQRRAAPRPPLQSKIEPEPERQRIPLQERKRKESPPLKGSLTDPLPYEVLAQMASSVVMIEVFDRQNQCFKTGSGVVIHESGYILTNFHVVCDGAFYGIRLEQSEKIYYTDELIKYHPLYDLALLRLALDCKPIHIYQGEKPLARGQKVVAIGSPLGLFNSVSDGIIGGFRKIEEMSMIQFTAPTSHGSSGGALLDLCGNLIGIITAGYDDGQNLNLAVDYETVLTFARGFLNPGRK